MIKKFTPMLGFRRTIPTRLGRLLITHALIEHETWSLSLVNAPGMLWPGPFLAAFGATFAFPDIFQVT